MSQDDIGGGAMSLFQVDDAQYGLPYNFGLVGLWYNKDLFAQAGIEAPAATWEEFLTDVQTLKDAGITPISLGGWRPVAVDVLVGVPRHPHRRRGGGGQRHPDRRLDRRGLRACRSGARSASWRSSPSSPAADAATHDEQQGDVRQRQGGYDAPGPVGGRARSVATASRGPASVKHSAGSRSRPSRAAPAPTDVFGGGDGFAVGRDAPPEAVEFLKWLLNADNASIWQPFNDGTLLPRADSAQFVTDPTLQDVAGEAQRGDLRPAVPRPGDARPTRHGASTRRSRASSRAPCPRRRSPQAITDAAAAAAG